MSYSSVSTGAEENTQGQNMRVQNTYNWGDIDERFDPLDDMVWHRLEHLNSCKKKNPVISKNLLFWCSTPLLAVYVESEK